MRNIKKKNQNSYIKMGKIYTLKYIYTLENGI